MNPFKARDKVVCIKAGKGRIINLIVGETYDVILVNSSHVFVNGKFERKNTVGNPTIVNMSEAYHFSYFKKKLACGLSTTSNSQTLTNKTVYAENQSSNPKKNKECNHNWKSYVGFNDSFEYCEVCDVKR